MDKPKLYSKCKDMQKMDNIFVLDKYLRLIEWKIDADSVLDVGCGDGSFSVDFLLPRLPKTVENFIGCDVSDVMVDFAKEKYGSVKRDFVKFDIASEKILVDFEEKFNFIFSFCVLHWVKKQRQAFKNMFEMLKPGGGIFLTFLATNPIFDVYETLENYPKWKLFAQKVNNGIGPYHFCQKRKEKLEDILMEVGFTVYVCKVEKRKYIYSSIEIFKESMMAVNYLIPKLPAEEVKNYMNDFMKEVRRTKCNLITIENVNNNNEECVRLNYEKFFVFALKLT